MEADATKRCTESAVLFNLPSLETSRCRSDTRSTPPPPPPSTEETRETLELRRVFHHRVKSLTESPLRFLYDCNIHEIMKLMCCFFFFWLAAGGHTEDTATCPVGKNIRSGLLSQQPLQNAARHRWREGPWEKVTSG